MCSGSEAGPYLRLIDFVYHSTLGLRVIKKKPSTSGGRAFEHPVGESGVLLPEPVGAESDLGVRLVLDHRHRRRGYAHSN